MLILCCRKVSRSDTAPFVARNTQPVTLADSRSVAGFRALPRRSLSNGRSHGLGVRAVSAKATCAFRGVAGPGLRDVYPIPRPLRMKHDRNASRTAADTKECSL